MKLVKKIQNLYVFDTEYTIIKNPNMKNILKNVENINHYCSNAHQKVI